jgi:hypothetical protein
MKKTLLKRAHVAITQEKGDTIKDSIKNTEAMLKALDTTDVKIGPKTTERVYTGKNI